MSCWYQQSELYFLVIIFSRLIDFLFYEYVIKICDEHVCVSTTLDLLPSSKTSYVFKKIKQRVNIMFENYNSNSCLCCRWLQPLELPGRAPSTTLPRSGKCAVSTRWFGCMWTPPTLVRLCRHIFSWRRVYVWPIRIVFSLKCLAL